MSLLWKRSMDLLSYPNVWIEFTGKDAKNSNKLVKYWIQDLPEEKFNEALDHITKYFIPDEPYCQSLGINYNVNKKLETKFYLYLL